MTSVARRLGRVVALSDRSRDHARDGALADVLAGRHLAVAFQPIVARRRAEGRERWCMDGVEALIRAHTTSGAVVRPDRLLPAIERAGLLQPLFMYVFAEALATWRDLRDLGVTVAVSVNVHAQALQDDELPRVICTLLDLTGLPPESFTLELTESGPIVDMGRAARNLWRLRRSRVRVALDDFGSGFSTRTRLDCLECDEIKIDKALVLGIELVDEQRRIVEHVAELAHTRGMTVCAEGVETQAALDVLARLGVDRAQGYLIGRPHFQATLAVALRRWGCGRDVDANGEHPQLRFPGFGDGGEAAAPAG